MEDRLVRLRSTVELILLLHQRLIYILSMLVSLRLVPLQLQLAFQILIILMLPLFLFSLLGQWNRMQLPQPDQLLSLQMSRLVVF